MSTFKSPIGPQPSNVYWRRRLVVVLGILAVIVIVVLIVARPNSHKPTAAKTPTPTHSASTSTTKPVVATPSNKVTACAAGSVSVTPVADATTYATGVDPKLSLKITNTGSTACTFNVGSNVQVYTITSGSETIWTSTDCQKNPVAATKTLKPGVPMSSTPFPWNRTRSSKTTCASTTLPKVTASGASYHLGVKINGVVSTKTTQFILK